MTELNWHWIGLGATVPPLAGLLAALPLWRKRHMIFGNIFATAIIFASSLALIFREYVEIDKATRACIDAGYTCWPEPSAFARFGIYASLGLLEVFAIFGVSLKVEAWLRSRDYAPEWRR